MVCKLSLRPNQPKYLTVRLISMGIKTPDFRQNPQRHVYLHAVVLTSCSRPSAPLAKSSGEAMTRVSDAFRLYGGLPSVITQASSSSNISVASSAYQNV